MKTILAFAALLLVAAAADAKNYAGYKYMNVEQTSARDVQALFKLESEAKVHLAKQGRVGEDAVAFLPPGKQGKQLKRLLSESGLKYQVHEESDVEAAFKVEREAIQKRKEEYGKLKQGDTRAVDFDIYNFHTHDEINQYLRDLAGEQ